jgi:dTDP-4-dehydrorhamnose 3,5-epimerase-like enzyme
MINGWSDNMESRDVLEYKFSGSKEFVDERGRITNYELPESINWIGWIESKKGTVRANHYHPIQEQKCILISGKYISVFKDLKKPNSPMTTQLMESGDVVVTKSNVAHTMVFLEDSLFLNLVNGEREHDNFGKHTIPYTLVNDRMRDELLKNYKSECRSCGNTRLECVVSLGNSPLANNLLNDENQEDELYPTYLILLNKTVFQL